jgi:hypothetical protein
MVATMDVIFRRTEEGYLQRTPYVDSYEPLEYTCDGTKGSLTFDGHYYIEDEEPTNEERAESPHMYLPQKLELYVHVHDAKPYKTEVNDQGITVSHYRTINKYAHVVEIYKRVKHASTNKISTIEGEGDVCFFPTNKQTIYFRVVRPLP